MKKEIKQTLEVLAIYVAILVFFAVVGCADRYTKDYSRLNVAYYNYHKKTEILLDSIASHDSTFLDVEGETNEYCDYLEAREHLDSIITRLAKDNK